MKEREKIEFCVTFLFIFHIDDFVILGIVVDRLIIAMNYNRNKKTKNVA